MSAAYIASRSLLAAGTLVIVLAALGAWIVDDFYQRLHFLAPVTSIGVPLIGLSLAIVNGWGETTAQILLTVFLLALTGAVVTPAVGRVAAQRDGVLGRESPE